MGKVFVSAASGVPTYVKTAVRDVAEHIERIPSLYHDLRIVLVAEPSIHAGEDNFGFGCFGWPVDSDKHEGPLEIYIAGGMVESFIIDEGMSQEDAIEALLHTIFHEFVHYQQWQQGKKPTERGVDKKASQLLAHYNPRYRKPSVWDAIKEFWRCVVDGFNAPARAFPDPRKSIPQDCKEGDV